ncbi:MAG TPA: DUF6454 family protein [Pirellulales bacterium]|nr:DUF6454 family protein [Pirellulales bacterium]
MTARLVVLLCLVIAAPVSWAEEVATVDIDLVDQQPIEYPTHHVQGLAVTADSYWISSVDRRARVGFVFRVDRATAKLAGKRELSFDAQFHPGGIELAGDSLWVPVAEYRPRSTSTILKLDAQSLETQASFTVDDHIGCLAVNAGGQITAANWDARTFYRFTADGKKLGETANPRPTAYQDLKSWGELLVGCGTEKVEGQVRPVVDCLRPDTLALEARWRPRGTLRSGGNNFCREGCAIFKGALFLMPEDGPQTTIYQFAAPRP